MTQEPEPEPNSLPRLYERPWAPSRLLPGIHQFAARGARVMVLADESLTLIDTGLPASGRRILRAIAEIGRSPRDIGRIIISHYHGDHLGGLSEVLAAAPYARVAIHASEAPYVRGEIAFPNPFQQPVVGAVAWPLLERFMPTSCPIHDELEDGDEWPDVLGGLRVIHSPGHTRGSLSLYLPARKVLFTADALQVLRGKVVGPSRLFSEDMDAGVRSIQKLATLEVDTLIFSHYRPIMRRAGERLRSLATSQGLV